MWVYVCVCVRMSMCECDCSSVCSDEFALSVPLSAAAPCTCGQLERRWVNILLNRLRLRLRHRHQHRRHPKVARATRRCSQLFRSTFCYEGVPFPLSPFRSYSYPVCLALSIAFLLKMLLTKTLSSWCHITSQGTVGNLELLWHHRHAHTHMCDL